MIGVYKAKDIELFLYATDNELRAAARKTQEHTIIVHDSHGRLLGLPLVVSPASQEARFTVHTSGPRSDKFYSLTISRRWLLDASEQGKKTYGTSGNTPITRTHIRRWTIDMNLATMIEKGLRETETSGFAH